MRRNPVELGHDALNGSGKVNRVRRGKCRSASVEKLFQFVITPPGLSDVMVGEETPIALHQKSCAKDVKLQKRSRSFCFERHHPLVVHLRLTCGIGGDTK